VLFVPTKHCICGSNAFKLKLVKFLTVAIENLAENAKSLAENAETLVTTNVDHNITRDNPAKSLEILVVIENADHNVVAAKKHLSHAKKYVKKFTLQETVDNIKKILDQSNGTTQ